MRKRILLLVPAALVAACLLGVLLYYLPPVHSRLAWRVEGLLTEARYALDPPEQAVFLPQGGGAPVAAAGLDGPAAQASMEAIVQATLRALIPTPGAVTAPASQPDAAAASPAAEAETPTPAPSPSPTATLPPLPPRSILTGITHEYQKMNNCGPANLSMALSFWGWQGDQRDTRAYLRPNAGDLASQGIDDKNVNPQEMVQFVETQTGLQALTRVGGDAELLKRFLAAGFPVIVEKGFQPPKEDWMGHYELFSGYDDERGRFITQDSYIMADFPLPYDELMPRWLDFNYVYVVLYPAERAQEVLAILGPDADIPDNYRQAAGRARAQAETLTGRDRFFALYNLGSSLVGLGDYPAAAQAYDQAFQVYAELSENNRPWRMLWYQAGPYAAYYHTGRYADVVQLADTTLAVLGRPTLEEALYWRGLAKEAQGDHQGAVDDLQTAYSLNPNSTPALEALQAMGSEPSQ